MPIFKRVHHVSVSIDRPPADVYAYAAEPANLPRWAAGLSTSTAIRAEGDALVVDSPMGTVRVQFVPRNALGVLDHDVILPSGEVVHNPLRVIANASGSEVVFTIYQRPGMSADDLARDVAAVEADLRALARLLDAVPA